MACLRYNFSGEVTPNTYKNKKKGDLMLINELDIINRAALSAVDLEEYFDAGLDDFSALINSVSNTDKGELIDLLNTVSDEIVARRDTTMIKIA